MRYLLKNVKAFSSLLAGEIKLNSNPASVVATNKDQKIYVLCVILINVAKYSGQTDIRTANTNVVRSTASSWSVDVVRCGHQLIRLTCLSSPVLQHNITLRLRLRHDSSLLDNSYTLLVSPYCVFP